MKRLKYLLLVAVLVICVTATAAAADEPSARISAHNLIVGDNVYIAYQVNVGGSVDEVGVFVWKEKKDSYTADDNPISAVEVGHSDSGKTYVFKFTDILATQMTDDFYAVAYAKKSGQYYYGEVDKYSILQYAYNKTGRTGKSGTADETLVSLLDGMLDYGAENQKYFQYKKDWLATDNFVQVKTVGAKLEDGTTAGLFKAGSDVTLTAQSATDWYDELGTKLGNGKTFTVNPTKNTVITATNNAPEQKEEVTITKSLSATSVAKDGTVAVNLAITNNTAEMQTVAITETLKNGEMLTDELTAGKAKDYYIPAGATVNVTYGLTASATGTITAETTASHKPTYGTQVATSLTVDTKNITCTSDTLTKKNVFLFGDYTMYSVQPLLAAMASAGGYKLNIVAATSNAPSGVQNSYNIQELFAFDDKNEVTGYSTTVKGAQKIKEALESTEKYDFVIPTGANWTLGDTENRQPKARAAIKYISDELAKRGKGETLYLLLSPAYDDGYDFSATYRDTDKVETKIFGELLTNISGYASHLDRIVKEAAQIKKVLSDAANVKFIKAGYAYTEAKKSVSLYRDDIVKTISYENASGKTKAYTVVNKYRFPNLNGQYLIAACIYKGLFGGANIPTVGFVKDAGALKTAANTQTVEFALDYKEPELPEGYIDIHGDDDITTGWDD